MATAAVPLAGRPNPVREGEGDRLGRRDLLLLRLELQRKRRPGGAATGQRPTRSTR
jgi:hypothetical protein